MCRILLPLTVAAAAIACTPQPSHTDDRSSIVEKYLGKWNYTQPDRATMTNITVSDAPGRTQVPTIGDLVVTTEGPDRIVGRTDLGCTWRFKATAASLELDPPSQLCHNPTQNVKYTVTQWTVTVNGDQEKETIRAKTHHPERDYDFVLENGVRTKTEEYDPEAAEKFTGTWAYDSVDPTTGINMRTTARPAPGDTRLTERSQEHGNVRITQDYDNRVTARTDDGCTWTLLARGNTARLDPAVQTFTRPTSAAVTLRSWTITTDGERQASMVTGTDEQGGNFILSTGSLSKR
ncbi:hypothetical protein [Nocardia jinanensis]|uniref:hypothetical protein n=1 Tax=Nocardia jinanensis TaxID=382504 RepID=UPI001669A2C0|nr:hypothetical protein [Nocardia jinanensis]